MKLLVLFLISLLNPIVIIADESTGKCTNSDTEMAVIELLSKGKRKAQIQTIAASVKGSMTPQELALHNDLYKTPTTYIAMLVEKATKDDTIAQSLNRKWITACQNTLNASQKVPADHEVNPNNTSYTQLILTIQERSQPPKEHSTYMFLCLVRAKGNVKYYKHGNVLCPLCLSPQKIAEIKTNKESNPKFYIPYSYTDEYSSPYPTPVILQEHFEMQHEYFKIKEISINEKDPLSFKSPHLFYQHLSLKAK